MKKTHAAVTGSGSALSRYQEVVVGRRSFGATIRYELYMLLSSIPGALGLLLRKIFWPQLFGSSGKGVAFGANVILRHPHRIHLGDRVVISEGCILDARNDKSDEIITLGDDVILSNYVMISCKNGSVKIGARTGVNAHTIIQSTNQCPVTVGEDVIIGPRCYIVGGGSYNTDRLDIPIWQQGIKEDGGVTLEEDIWLGANVTILGGVTMGTGSIAAAGAVLTKSIPTKAICGGVPGKIIKMRDGSEVSNPHLNTQSLNSRIYNK
jgi:acetyltransferase-like isoleucine patch superfamily enzyme